MLALFVNPQKSTGKSEQPDGSAEYKVSADARKNWQMTSKESSSRNRIRKEKAREANDRIKRMMRVWWEIYRGRKRSI